MPELPFLYSSYTSNYPAITSKNIPTITGTVWGSAGTSKREVDSRKRWIVVTRVPGGTVRGGTGVSGT